MNTFIARIKQFLFRSNFSRSVTILAGSTAIGQGLAVAASPVITRLYTPEDFGVLAVYMSSLSMIAVIASLRYEVAIPLAEDNNTAANVVALSLATVLITSVFVGLFVWAFGQQLVAWVNTPQLYSHLWLLPLGVLGVGIYQVFNYWAVRIRAFNHIGRTKINQAISLIFIQIIFGLSKLGAIGLLVGYFAGQIAGVATLAGLAWKNDKLAFSKVSFSGMISAAKRYLSFPLLSSWSALSNSAALFLPPLLLAAFYDSQVSGWFTLGLRTIQFPLAFIAQSFSQVYFGEAAKLIKTDCNQLKQLFKKTSITLFVVGIIPFVFSIFSPSIFAIIFGPNWYSAGLYMQRLSAMFLVQFIVSPLSMTLNVLERLDLQIIWDIVRLFLVVSSFLLAEVNNLSAKDAITLYGLSMLIAYATLFVISWQQINARSKLEMTKSR